MSENKDVVFTVRLTQEEKRTIEAINRVRPGGLTFGSFLTKVLSLLRDAYPDALELYDLLEQAERMISTKKITDDGASELVKRVNRLKGLKDADIENARRIVWKVIMEYGREEEAQGTERNTAPVIRAEDVETPGADVRSVVNGLFAEDGNSSEGDGI